MFIEKQSLSGWIWNPKGSRVSITCKRYPSYAVEVENKNINIPTFVDGVLRFCNFCEVGLNTGNIEDERELFKIISQTCTQRMKRF